MASMEARQIVCELAAGDAGEASVDPSTVGFVGDDADLVNDIAQVGKNVLRCSAELDKAVKRLVSRNGSFFS